MKNWDTLLETTLGEYHTFLWLLRRLSREEATLAATGWDGDRIRLLRDHAGSLALFWVSTWDSPHDAEQFVNSVGRYRDLCAVEATSGTSAVAEPGAGWTLSVQRKERDAVLLLCADAELADQVLESALPFVFAGPERPGRAASDELSTRAEEERILELLGKRQRRLGYTVSGTELISTKHALRLKLPNDSWSYSAQTPNPMIHAMALHSGGSSVNLIVLPSDGAALDEIVSALRGQIELMALDGEVTESEGQLADVPTREFVYRGQVGGVETHIRQIILIRGSDCLLFSATTLRGQALRDESQLIVGSLMFDPEPQGSEGENGSEMRIFPVMGSF
jgi:hypothetical protein